MTRERRGADPSGSTADRGGSPGAGGTPGKRTLVEGVQPAGVVQRKESKASLGFGEAPVDAVPVKDDSARFEGDQELAKILAGAKTLKRGDTGLQVTKLQQALVDMGYPIVSNCAEINKKHSAVPSAATERAKLKPVIDKLVATPVDVQKLLEVDIGWEGAQLEGQVFLQRYKEGTDAANRERLWKLFYICIHEYIHALEHDDYHKYAETFRASRDQVRYNTLVEGMCDFYTDNVRATVAITSAIQKNVEGPYHDVTKPPPAVKVGSYPSRAQAEQLVSIVGIRNAEAAFFKGNTKAIGGP